MANYNSLKNAGVLTPAANTDLGSATNRYANVFMSGNINMSGTSLSVNTIVTPKVSSIVYSGDDTAASPAGGQTITLNGSGFQVGASVLIAGTVVNSVSFVSSTQITFVTPAISAGSYVLYVINSDGGTAISIPGIQYSGVPAWSTTAGSLGSPQKSTSVSYTVEATGDNPVTYSVFSGALPSGLSLNTSSGVISGTTPDVGSATTFNFTIRATDAQNQDTDRAFSLTIMTAPPVGQAEYTTAGTYSWTAPGGVTSVSVVCVGGGGAGHNNWWSGAGGGLGWKNNIAVTPGQSYTVVVGAAGDHLVTPPGSGGSSHFINTSTVAGLGGTGGSSSTSAGGGFVGDGGGTGGAGGGTGGGGAAGYSGNGGDGRPSETTATTPGSGGSAGGGSLRRGGGGVGILGQGASGASKSGGGGGTGGSGGASASDEQGSGGGLYGGGGGGYSFSNSTQGAGGAVRIIWGTGRAFPSTLTTDQ